MSEPLRKNERVYTPHGDGRFFEEVVDQQTDAPTANVACGAHHWSLEAFAPSDVQRDRRDARRQGR